MFKALKRAIAKAKGSAKYERPLLSEILDYGNGNGNGYGNGSGSGNGNGCGYA